ncbi:IQCE-like protein [Mya arenaria]|uniref:IQCE-like protein n=1 Tax=Mya arenaria TaxID=6604 RepID=A0ABY7DEQ3_MYAAR|nr:IQCE-like protein [Mya arenaria]
MSGDVINVSSSTNKTTPRRPVTPGKKKKRPQSAPTYHRSGHELWMNAVKHRKTGFTTESTGMNTFNGKRPRDKDMPYLSTPSYLRQIAGTEKQGKMIDPTAKASPGTPAYKSQEEYYEQILEFKRQVKEMQQESSTMRAKIRRVEEDNLKKEKEIDSLLHPHKSEELRRTLADKRPDSGSVIHSLKQKILKLETQLRDKEGAYITQKNTKKTSIRWECSQKRGLDCLGAVNTDIEVQTVLSSKDHNHEADFDKIEATKAVNVMKNGANISRGRPQQLVVDVLQPLPVEVRAAAGTTNAQAAERPEDDESGGDETADGNILC